MPDFEHKEWMENREKAKRVKEKRPAKKVPKSEDKKRVYPPMSNEYNED